jgi:hypothetical protein
MNQAKRESGDTSILIRRRAKDKDEISPLRSER